MEAELIRIVKFGTVGVINTLIDFSVFNILTTRRVGLGKIKANLIASTIAMTFCFLANKHTVFMAGGNIWVQAITFLAVTAFGLWVIQNVVMYHLLYKWQWPSRAVTWARNLWAARAVSHDFLLKNSAKVASVLVTMTWDYIMYQNFVFKL